MAEKIEGRVAKLLDDFDDLDTKKTGKIDLSAFKRLFGIVMGGRMDDSAVIFFKGIDADGNKYIERGEFETFIRAALTGDKLYTAQMAFRAFDTNGDRMIDGQELKAFGDFCGKNVPQAEVQKEIEKVSGKKNGSLTYAQAIQWAVGKKIDPKSDPYAGTKAGKK
jgi:Ca2+-binding EF-hand superfamily protein